MGLLNFFRDVRRWLAEGDCPHKATHQDGGVDEISVAGLSGLLADKQTALQHGLSNATFHSSALTSGKMVKSDASGLPADASNTDAEVADAVTKKHANTLDHARQHAITDASDHTSTATNGKMLKANANGLPVDATNTDADVADAVTKKHDAATAGSGIAVAGQAVSLNVTALDADTPVDADEFLFYDVGSSHHNKVTGANLKTYIGAAAAGNGVVYKGADESVASSTALQDDNHLLFSMLANTTYCFEVCLFVDAGAGGIKVSVNGPAGAGNLRFYAGVNYGYSSGADAHLYSDVATSYDTALLGAYSVANPRIIWLWGSVENGANAANLVLRWAQQVSNVANSSVLRGSFLRWWKV